MPQSVQSTTCASTNWSKWLSASVGEKVTA